MDKVMADLQRKQADETRKHTSSLSYMFAGAAGPDGGMSAQAASLDSLRYTGEWNSKHTEDYINMVKAELKRKKITVTPEIEKMMIDKMIKDEIPKSSIDYIISEVIHRLYHQKGGHQHHLLLATGIEQIAFGESYLRTGRKAIQSQPCGKSSRSYVGSHS